eukprot:3171522-Pyramimonas_sp.AAC.1
MWADGEGQAGGPREGAGEGQGRHDGPLPGGDRFPPAPREDCQEAQPARLRAVVARLCRRYAVDRLYKPRENRREAQPARLRAVVAGLCRRAITHGHNYAVDKIVYTSSSRTQ